VIAGNVDRQVARRASKACSSSRTLRSEPAPNSTISARGPASAAISGDAAFEDASSVRVG
jgi:hypothetical protein